jgi:hypothetical protein
MNRYFVGMMMLAVVNEGNAQQPPEGTERMFFILMIRPGTS